MRLSGIRKYGGWQVQNSLSLLLVACALMLGSVPAVAEVIHIDDEQLKRLRAEGVVLIDLRTAPEWKETGVVDKSHLITLFDAKGRADPEKWLAEVDRVAGKDQPVILICRTGNRTRAAAQYMDKLMPKRKIYNVSAGIKGWIGTGGPVVSQKDNLQHAGISCGPVC